MKLTNQDIRKILKEKLAASGKSQASFARSFGITPQYMSDIMRGYRYAGCPPILKNLGLRKVVFFESIEAK